MRSLETRIRKMEQADRGSGIVVVPIYEGESEEDAMRHEGVTPGPDDLVVLIKHFSQFRGGVF